MTGYENGKKPVVTEDELDALTRERDSKRVTEHDIEAMITHEHYFTAKDGVFGEALVRQGHTAATPVALSVLTFCVLTLRNGYTITGQSACADPKSYDKEIGRRIARKSAVDQIWPLLGFDLRNRLARANSLLKSVAFDPQPGFATYVGTKVVHAKPMTRGDYNIMRGWIIPENENENDPGYLVEYADRIEDLQHVPPHSGYVSWSPKDVFEKSYKVLKPGEPV